MSIVSIVKCADYDRDRVLESVGEALRLAELDGAMGQGMRVLVKPNLLSARAPEQAVTTHPMIVRALVELCKARGCEVAIGDSPPFAGRNPERYARLCEATGMAQVARELNVPIVRFEESFETVVYPQGRFYKNFEIARSVLDADLIINVPKLKTHGLTVFTGAVKNVFGCVPGIRKGLFHVQAAEEREVFAQMLVDLYGALPRMVHVMDAVVGMDGEGPNMGSPKQIGAILASSDAVALDAVSCEMVGIEAMSVATTRLAYEQGLGCADLAAIDVRGDSLDDMRVADFRLSSGRNEWARIPAPIRRLLRRQLVATPRVLSSECIGCGDCADVCPVKAITSGRPPKIDLHKCIRCYCCHEVCNYSAAQLRQGWLARMIVRGREKE